MPVKPSGECPCRQAFELGSAKTFGGGIGSLRPKRPGLFLSLGLSQSPNFKPFFYIDSIGLRRHLLLLPPTRN